MCVGADVTIKRTRKHPFIMIITYYANKIPTRFSFLIKTMTYLYIKKRYIIKRVNASDQIKTRDLRLCCPSTLCYLLSSVLITRNKMQINEVSYVALYNM